VKLGPVGGDSYRLYSLRDEGIIAGALETTTIPVEIHGGAIGAVGDVLKLATVTATKATATWQASGGGTYVNLQAATPGVAQAGHLNITGIARAGGLGMVEATGGTDMNFPDDVFVLYCNPGGAAMTVTLEYNTQAPGRVLSIVNGSVTDSVIISPDSGLLINGAASYTLAPAVYPVIESVIIHCWPTIGWFIIAKT